METLSIEALETEGTTTEATVVVPVESLEQLRQDVVHADLFGSFLICGTLVGLAIFWRWLK